MAAKRVAVSTDCCMTGGMAIIGARILGGRYTLLEQLGAGGMAMVYRARDEVLGREVAVKVLSPQFAADPGFLARFEREARHVASISHPRIVTVFDSGIDENTPFIVMELVAGRTLRQVIDQVGPLPAREAVTIASAVCEALEAAHAAGLVHRDIKPANIVLSGGEVKVLDFGIARADGPGRATRTQAVLGTAEYLSPEQASGGQVGPQTDLYSLGCVLFEMLTGAPPFTADSALGVAYRQVHDDPGPPSARRPGLAPQLDWITSRMLAKNPADRPPNAAAARAWLLAAVSGDHTRVLPRPQDGEVITRRQQSARRRSSRFRPIDVALLIALAAALAALTTALLTRPAAPAAAPTQSPATSQRPSPSPSRPATVQPSLPPTAAAAATMVGDLQVGVSNGQVSPEAAQDMFDRLRELLFIQPGDNSAQQETDQRYSELVSAYDERVQRGDITGAAAAALRRDLDALGKALGAI
jgi:eukaryotic-like serine/threonine-protein kinase